MSVLQMDQVLIEEAAAISGSEAGFSNLGGAELYQALNGSKFTALCLSGGGIRSATFSLGVVQSLAKHVSGADRTTIDAKHSLLSQFQYMSTVSGGGYLGGFLSAWLAREHSVDADGWSRVWASLIGRGSSPDTEPSQLSWLRSYSNYLTPKLGAASADAWTAVAILLRNLVLNWLVIVPVVYAAVLLIKLFAITTIWLASFDSGDATPAWITGVLAVIGLILALREACVMRPTHGRSPGGQRAFLFFNLLPGLCAGILSAFTLAFPVAESVVRNYVTGSEGISIAAFAAGGFYIYAVSWIIARPPYARFLEAARDFVAWAGSGAVFGALIAWGIILYFQAPDGGAGYFKPKEVLLLAAVVPWILVSKLLAEMIFVGLTSTEEGSDSDREWLGRSAGWYLVSSLCWLFVIFLLFVGSDVLSESKSAAEKWLFGSGVGAGLITAVLGKSRLTPAKGPAKSKLGLSLNVILAIAVPVFGSVLIIAISSISDYFMYGTGLTTAPFFQARVTTDGLPSWPGGWLLVIVLAAVMAVCFVSSFFVNINRFSLHALYRNRLIRGYLGASNRTRGETGNLFTGFNEYDNLPVYNLWPQQTVPDKWPKVGEDQWRPFHVINIALNIVSTAQLAWQERKAEPFTVSALHSGSAKLGFRYSARYGDRDGISLGTAMAISGAAVSSNMGYHSSPPLELLLTLFNVRLGWWLGNPGPSGHRTFDQAGPPFAAKPLFFEMLGLTTDTRDYVYLSDGGHFENLGLYEMVRRRCLYILVVDAGCDKEFAFEDLGNAVRKIAIDLGVTITFSGVDVLRLRANPDVEYKEFLPPFHAVGTIDYPAADGGGEAGTILYIKPAFHSNNITNVGVRNYATANVDFPHETTADQWFSESQFESYRALGEQIMDLVIAQVIATPDCPTNPSLAEIFRRLPQTVP